MARVLITGMSGVGKSSVLKELGERGYSVVDTDYGHWKTESGLWDEVLMGALLGESTELIVAGTVENQRVFYDRFDHVVLLSAPSEVILERVRARASNPYGSTATEQAEIVANLATVEPLLRRGATVEFDATQPLDAVVAEIEGLLDRPSRFT
jgi:dephospho-CoA kinase